MQEECQKVGVKRGAFDVTKVREWEDVRTINPRAKRPSTHFLVGEKGVEREKGDDGRYYKARLVLDGDRVFDLYGAKVHEALAHYVPASLVMIRVSEFHAVTVPNGVTADGDAEDVFIQADWEGGPMWISLPKEIRPPNWVHYRHPVGEEKKSLCGSQRAGLNWGNKVRLTLVKKSHGWTWERDAGELSIYTRPVPRTTYAILLIIFTDGFRLSGPRNPLIAALMDLDADFDFSEKSKKDPFGGSFAGFQKLQLPAPLGVLRIEIHQSRYTQLVLEKVRRRIG